MLLYETVIATCIAVILVMAAIGGLVARVMMGPEELALLREAREMRADMDDLNAGRFKSPRAEHWQGASPRSFAIS
jgi:hypothetical protein